jgi:hypothetical protein
MFTLLALVLVHLSARFLKAKQIRWALTPYTLGMIHENIVITDTCRL